MKKINLSSTEVAEFFEEYILLRQAEQSEKQALKIISEHQENKAMQRFLSSLIEAQNLIKGLSEFPQLIPEYIISLLQQAKKNDNELEVLASISTHLSSIDLINIEMPYKQKLKQSLFYPCFLLVICFALFLLTTVFVIPAFEELFVGFGADLPAFTKFVISVSKFLEKSFVFFIVLIIAAIVFFQSSLALGFKSKLILMLPSIGKLSRETETAYVIKALHLLLSHDFSLEEALRLSATATKNTVIANALLFSSDEVEIKRSFIETLALEKVFSTKTLHVLTVFDKTKNLDLLQNFTRQISGRLTSQGKTSLRSISIALLVFCWLVVGSTVIACYLPIFKLGAAVG